MTHLKSITLPKHATIISDRGSLTASNDEVVPILETTFGFVLDLVTIKGKGSE